MSNWADRFFKTQDKSAELFSGDRQYTNEAVLCELEENPHETNDELLSVIQSVTQQTAHFHLTVHAEAIVRGLQYTQSPIERIFLLSLISTGSQMYVERITILNEEKLEEINQIDLTEFTGSKIIIEPQKQIDDYRVDFFVTWEEYVREKERAVVSVVVECDGHDFHEKTKQQASSDKKRDRALQKLGHTVFRYSGADIWKNPHAPAFESLNLLHERARKIWHEKRRAMGN